MDKTALGPFPILYPMPAMLIGAIIGGKANFMTASWGGVACHEPPMLSVAVRPARYTYQGIVENRVFSVNIPSASMARETDLCGIVSGAGLDKATLCGFTVERGSTGAPLIAECPLCLECSVHDILELGTHHLLLGRIEQTWVDTSCVRDGKPDGEAIDPLVYMSGAEKVYARVGDILAKAFSAGKVLKP